MMRVLVGEISSYKAIVVCRFLKKNYPDLEIHAYDYKRFSNSFHTRFIDKYHYVQFTNRNDYVKSLSKLIEKYEIGNFIPVHSDFIENLLYNKQCFGNSLSYLGAHDEYLKLHKKDQLLALASSLGVNIPKIYNSIEEAVCPFVAKPSDLSSSKGVKYAFTQNDKERLLKSKLDNYIFQEYVKGSGCGLSVYASYGSILKQYGHKRLAEYPVSGGSSVYRTIFYDTRMNEAAERILGAVRWTGFAMFEFKHTSDNRIVLLEVNPRIWGSINQGLQQGVNYFEPLFGVGKDESNDKQICTYLSPQLYLSLFFYILKGQFIPILNFFRNIGYNRADVGLFSDPRGYLSVIFRKFLK